MINGKIITMDTKMFHAAIHGFPDYVPFGIPLTEDWLLKFGFCVVHKNNKHYCIQDPNGYKDFYKIHIFPTLNDQWHIAFSDNLSGKNKDYSPTTKIMHVHQLQNLFFALTGKEIEFK